MKNFNVYFRLISTALTDIQCVIEHPKVHMNNKCTIISKKIVISRIVSFRPSCEGWVKICFTEHGSGDVTKGRRRRLFSFKCIKAIEHSTHGGVHRALLTPVMTLYFLSHFKSSVQISVDFFFFLWSLFLMPDCGQF